jgi:glycerate dehydrogenase
MLRAFSRPAAVGRRAFSAATALPRALVTNLKTLNYDGNIDMTRLGEVASVESHDYSTTDEIISRSQGFEVLITKEVPVTAETIGSLGADVRLICEAGTGFNNIDLGAACARGITVTNVADYSSDSVAHLALT